MRPFLNETHIFFLNIYFALSVTRIDFSTIAHNFSIQNQKLLQHFTLNQNKNTRRKWYHCYFYFISGSRKNRHFAKIRCCTCKEKAQFGLFFQLHSVFLIFDRFFETTEETITILNGFLNQLQRVSGFRDKQSAKMAKRAVSKESFTKFHKVTQDLFGK